MKIYCKNTYPLQLVVHILDADDAPPVVRGLAVIDDGGFVTMGEEGIN